MKIIQLSCSMSPGDAVSNHIFAIDSLLKERGFETEIQTEFFDPRVAAKRKNFDLQAISPQDAVLYHFASHSKIADLFPKIPCKKAIMYHNATPPQFFKGYDFVDYQRVLRGRRQLPKLACSADFAFTVSQFNRKELVQAGFAEEKTFASPLIVPLSDYEKAPDSEILQKYSQKKGANFLFTGRIAPNKKFEDAIKVFYYYKNFVGSDARLFFVGSFAFPKYYAQLQGFVAELGLRDVIWTGHIPFSQILAYYALADVFVCMSEHEGFCVPLVEAMKFGIPIVAFDSSAVGETLNGAGILLKEKDFIAASEKIRELQENEAFRAEIVQGEKKRLAELSTEKTSAAFLEKFLKFLNGEI